MRKTMALQQAEGASGIKAPRPRLAEWRAWRMRRWARRFSCGVHTDAVKNANFASGARGRREKLVTCRMRSQGVGPWAVAKQWVWCCHRE